MLFPLHYKSWYLISMLFTLQVGMAQYSPFFQNYPLTAYNAGNQNWGVSIANDGKVYFANAKGLLEYDGLKWELWELPNKTTLRSVFVKDDRIYTGSYEEFGFWKKNEKGLLIYESISKLVDKADLLDQEIWEIIPLKDAIIFKSFLNVYVFKNNEVTLIRPPSTVISCDIINDELYISTLEKGIFILKENKLIPFLNDPVLKNARIIAISALDKNNILITTSLKGCYLYNQKELKPWQKPINNPIKQHQLNTFSLLTNGDMVFGTIKNGVYITDKLGIIKYHINKEIGLINNTVLCQYIDNDSELWLGLDNGIARVNIKSDNLFYTDVSGELGAVYAIIKFNNTIYMGSNTGLYYLDPDGILKFVEGSQGQVWDLKEINGQLFCGHNDGTYVVTNNKLKLISKYTGGWVLRKVPEEDIYIQGTYAGLVAFTKKNQNWEVKHLGKTTIPIRYLIFENNNTAWAAHAYKGLYRIHFNATYDSILDIVNYENKGLWSNYNVKVYKIKNDITFKTNQGWQKYEPLLDTIVPHTLLNELLGHKTDVISDYELPKLAIKNKDFISIKDISSSKENIYIPNKHYKDRLLVGDEKITLLEDSTYALSLNDGFMIINGNSKMPNNPLSIPTIDRIIINGQPVIINPKGIESSFRNNNVVVGLSASNSYDHSFEYLIKNSDSLKNWRKIEKDKLVLSNLNDGEHTILFRTINSYGEISPSKSLRINILPPWYKTSLGFILYGLLLIFTGIIIYRLHKRKIEKEEKRLKHLFEKEQEKLLTQKTLENEKHIIELKNESLQREIKLKSKQLANTAMSLTKKNEVLQNLKKELILNKTNFDNYFSFKKLRKQIDDSISQEDEWQLFENNFNQVHEEFFERLNTLHPQLSQKDLKICALLKMNLPNKEISQILNVSVRGVETQRYRLKKKLNLKTDENLTNYLTDLI